MDAFEQTQTTDRISRSPFNSFLQTAHLRYTRRGTYAKFYPFSEVRRAPVSPARDFCVNAQLNFSLVQHNMAFEVVMHCPALSAYSFRPLISPPLTDQQQT